MSAPTLFLFLTIAGAVLFFAAGYLFRLLFGAAPPDPDASKSAMSEEITKLKLQLDERQAHESSLAASLKDELEKKTEEINLLILEKEAKAEAASNQPDEIQGDESREKREESESKAETESGDEEQEKSLSNRESLQISALKKEIAETKKRLSRSNTALEIAKEEARKLKKEMADAPKAEVDSEEVDELKRALASAEERASGRSKLERENRYLRKEVQHLSTQVVKPKKASKSETLKMKRSFDSEIKEIISGLLDMDQVDSVVVSDADGTLVGGVGDDTVFKGLAELCGQVADIGQDEESKQPLSETRLIHLKDVDDRIVACRMFRRNSEVYILSTMGRNLPPGEGMLELTIGDLSDDQ